MKKSVAAFSILSIFLLASCLGSGVTPFDITETQNIQPASETPQLTPVSSATTSPTKTLTSAPSTTISTVVPSATVTPDIHLQTTCLEISNTTPQNLTGIVILEDLATSSVYLLELSNDRLVQMLPPKDPAIILSFAVAPNREWLAYLQYSTALSDTPLPLLTLTQTDGKPRHIITFPRRYVSELIGWLDNQHLLIQAGRNKADSLLSSVLVLDPFTKLQQKLLPDYPQIYDAYPPLALWGPTVYDPTLNRVVYPRTSGSDLLMTLWNRETQQAIVNLGGVVFDTPQWSPDGQRVVIAKSKSESQDAGSVDQELFTIHRDGEVVQLTNLSERYSKVLIGPFSWSPNGRYIAFWLSVEGETFPDLYPDIPVLTEPIRRLAVLDTITQETVNYCVPGSQTVLPPIWSSDSQGILIENSYDNSSSPKNHVYIIDRVHELAFQIADDLRPVGWMNPIP